MAGFRDNRNYVGVFMITYMLLKVFSKLKKAKFMLAIDENSLCEKDMNKIQGTFASFLKLMRYK